MPVSPFLAPERDSAFKRARVKAGGTTPYSVPGAIITAVNTTTGSVNNDMYAPCYAETPIIVDQLAFEVQTAQASQNARCGMYRADTDWQPVGAPLADSGDISTGTTGVKTYTPATPLFLPRGRYLTVFAHSSTTAVFRRYEGQVPGHSLDSALGTGPFLILMAVSRSYAAFPTPGTPWTDLTNISTTGFRYIVVLRVSTP